MVRTIEVYIDSKKTTFTFKALETTPYDAREEVLEWLKRLPADTQWSAWEVDMKGEWYMFDTNAGECGYPDTKLSATKWNRVDREFRREFAI